MILFKPYVDLSKRQENEVWIYSVTVTVFTNTPVTEPLALSGTVSESPVNGFYEATLAMELQDNTTAWKSAHVFPHAVKIELGEIPFSSSCKLLKVKLYDSGNSVNLGLTIVHQDDVEEEGMPG